MSPAYRRTPPFPTRRLPTLPILIIPLLAPHIHRQLHNTTPLDVVHYASLTGTRDQIPQLRMNDGDARGDDETRVQVELCEFGRLDPGIGEVARDGGCGDVDARGGGG